MSGPRKKRFSPETVRKLIYGWMAFVALAGIAAFVILFLTLNNRAARVAEEQSATEAATEDIVTTPIVVPTEAPTNTPDPAAEPTATPTPPQTTGLDSQLALGGQVPGYVGHPDVMRSAGMTWVKYQIKWDTGVDPVLATEMVEGGHNNGFKVLLSIAGQPYPQDTIDYEAYVDFLAIVAENQPDAIEIWNEMNLDREWPAGQIDPTAYVEEMLAPAYEAIKAVSPQTAVIIGALAPTGFDNTTNAWSDARYVQGLAAANAADYADCIGVHHNSGTTAPSARSGHVSDPGDNHYSWYFLPTVEVYREGMNDQLPVCVTEFGYLTPDGFDTPIPENFAWGANNTVEDQAAWLAEGVNIAQELGYVDLLIVWNVDFDSWGDDPQGGYAILRPNGTCPACATLNQAIAD